MDEKTGFTVFNDTQEGPTITFSAAMMALYTKEQRLRIANAMFKAGVAEEVAIIEAQRKK